MRQSKEVVCHTCGVVGVVVCLNMVVAGCGPSAPSNPTGAPSGTTSATGQSIAGTSLPLGQYPPVTAAEIPNLFCNARSGKSDVPDEFEWKFNDDDLRITGPAIPESLVTVLGLKSPPAKSIVASWTFAEGRLTLSDFVVDDQAVELSPVELSIFKSAPTVWRINIGGDQFAFVRG